MRSLSAWLLTVAIALAVPLGCGDAGVEDDAAINNSTNSATNTNNGSTTSTNNGGTTSTNGATTSTNSGTTSTNNGGTTSTNNATTSTNNGTSTSTNNSSTGTNNGTTSTNNATTSTNNGTTSTNNATTSTNNGTTSTNNGTTSTNNGTTGGPDTGEDNLLFNLVNAYRVERGLSEIPYSPSLTLVAEAHVADTNAHGASFDPECNLHSWSDNGDWSACCYTSDHAQAQCMWDKPRELTEYPGNGYEISAAGSNISAERALDLWKGSPGHHNVIINADIWDRPWGAMGAAVEGGSAVVWFGHEADPAAP